MSHEEITTNHEQAIDINRPIAELLPRYYEAHGTNPTYEIERSMPIDGHEVAWLRYQGEVAYDITGHGQEGNHYEGHTLECACKFTEGVGWGIDEQRGTPVGYIGGESCIKKEAAEHLRHLELRQEYQDRGMLDGIKKYNPEAIEAVMLDLITKSQADEFLEGSSGASFWGGYYYLQTVGEIMGIPMKQVWEATNALIAEKRIRLEGMVVQDYREPYKAKTYEASAVPEAVLDQEKPDKIWALVPRPEQDELDLSELTIDDQNRTSIIGRCIVGLAHNEELAKARLEEAVTHPRLSHERLYQSSFVEARRSAGTLAVIAYTARTSDQKEEWLVEGFLGDAIEPEVHTLAMYHSTTFGIDVDDLANLNTMIDQWYPS